MQHKNLLAAEGQSVAALIVTTLQLIYTDVVLDLFWAKVEKECEKIGVEETVTMSKKGTKTV